MAEFTKGPWVVDDIFEEGGLDIVLGYDVPRAGSPILIAFVHGVDEHGGPPKTKSEVRANANLLAAAPELLAACEGLLAVYEELNARFDMGDCDETIAARAAIQKARTP